MNNDVWPTGMRFEDDDIIVVYRARDPSGGVLTIEATIAGASSPDDALAKAKVQLADWAEDLSRSFRQ